MVDVAKEQHWNLAGKPTGINSSISEARAAERKSEKNKSFDRLVVLFGTKGEAEHDGTQLAARSAELSPGTDESSAPRFHFHVKGSDIYKKKREQRNILTVFL